MVGVQLRTEIARACGAGALEAHFQPIVDIPTRLPVGVESLARWRRTDGTIVAPADFIPALEHAGKMRALTESMMGLSLDAVGEWREAGHECYVSVNVTAEDLVDADFAADIARELIARDIPPTALVVEITEQSLVGDPTQAVETLDSLQQAGVKIGLDDFGTGFSSLTHLVDLPVDAVKVDQRFVGAMTTSAPHAAIVETIVDLAHRLDLRVVAEGVEDQATWDALSSLRTERAQGFLCARPTPLERIVDVLADLEISAHANACVG